MKILIVDDDPGTVNALRVGLSSAGYKLVGAESASQAIEIIETLAESAEPVEFMITDMKMPGMDGLELIKSVKKARPDILTILITAYGSNDIRKEVTGLDGCGYLEKPFTPVILEMLLKSIDDIKRKLV